MEENNENNYKSYLTNEKQKIPNIKCERLSEYIKLNILSFQNLKNKNYKLAKDNFEKCVQLSKEIDEFKTCESLTNYSMALYYCGQFEDAYNNLIKSKEISSKIYEDSEEISQIYFIHLRTLSNLSLISMNLNDISYSKKIFYECISLIKKPKIKDMQFQISMLKELFYIFFRFDSLNKFHEINKINENNSNNLMGINNEIFSSIELDIKLDDKGLYYLHKSIIENNMTFWLNYLEKEINRNKYNEDANGYIFLLINKIAALYCLEGYNNNKVENAMKILIRYYQNNFEKKIYIKDNNFNKVLVDFKKIFTTAIEYYKQLEKLEKEFILKSLELKLKNNNGKNNKILINLLFRNSLKYLNNLNYNQEGNITEMKKHIEYAMTLIENNKINWNILSIINIDTKIIKTLNKLFHNLKIIRLKYFLKYNFQKFKLITLGYKDMSDKMQKNYKKSEKFLNKQLKSLSEGSVLLKFNFNSKGFSEHYYKINKIRDVYYLSIYKKISDSKPYKMINLEELNNITIGFKSKNLINKIKDEIYKKYKPWYFLSLWLSDRTIDLYFDNDEEMNKWFEGIYFFNRYIIENKKMRGLNYFFFTKLKLRLLYKLRSMKYNLPIIKQLKHYESQNEVEYQSLPLAKTLLLYTKVCQKIGKIE